MEDYRLQQIEAISMVSEYIEKLIPAMTEVCEELTGTMKADTLDYLKQIIDAFNFVIETYNVTKDVVNEDGVLIIDSELDKEVNRLSDAMIAKDYKKAGMIMSGSIIDFLKVYHERAIALSK